MKTTPILGALGAVAVLSACQTTTTSQPAPSAIPAVEPFRAVAMNLPPVADRDRPQVGDVFVYEGPDGEVYEDAIVAVDGNLMTGRSSDGCEYVIDRTGYSKSVSWRNCDGFSGEAELTSSGSIFPLEIGSTEVIEVAGADGENTWELTRTCTVDSTGVADVPAGSFDVYRVFCERADGRVTRTYLVDAETGITVYWNRVRDGEVRGGGALVEIRRAAA